MHSKALRRNGETEQRIHLLNGWHEPPLHTPWLRAPKKPRTLGVVQSLLQEARHPIGDRVATAHVSLNQPVDHERGRHVNTVLTAIFARPGQRRPRRDRS